MNKNNKTILILTFSLLFSCVSMLIIFYSDFTINILNNIKEKLDKFYFYKWIGTLFIINLFILVLILFLKNNKNKGDKGLKGEIGLKGINGENENCIKCTF